MFKKTVNNVLTVQLLAFAQTVNGVKHARSS